MELQSTQWSSRFEKLQRNRLIVGAVRYSTFEEKKDQQHGYDLLGSARQRLDLYETTGNQEHLVDCANLCMIEFECPTHPAPHFTAIDDGIHVQKD